jgi:hypothetical protein
MFPKCGHILLSGCLGNLDQPNMHDDVVRRIIFAARELDELLTGLPFYEKTLETNKDIRSDLPEGMPSFCFARFFPLPCSYLLAHVSRMRRLNLLEDRQSR